MVASRSAQRVTLYVDGVMDQATTDQRLASSMANSAPLYIGSERQGSVYFRGAIDDVRIYNRALTSQEIQALAQ